MNQRKCRNAGGRTSDLTSELVKTCQKLIGVETCMHLTCTNMPKEKVDSALKVRPVMYHSYFMGLYVAAGSEGTRLPEHPRPAW